LLFGAPLLVVFVGVAGVAGVLVVVVVGGLVVVVGGSVVVVGGSVVVVGQGGSVVGVGSGGAVVAVVSSVLGPGFPFPLQGAGAAGAPCSAATTSLNTRGGIELAGPMTATATPASMAVESNPRVVLVDTPPPVLDAGVPLAY